MCMIFFQAAVSSLKQEYKEGEMTLQDAEALAIKVLSKTLDMTKLTAEKSMYIILYAFSIVTLLSFLTPKKRLQKKLVFNKWVTKILYTASTTLL